MRLLLLLSFCICCSTIAARQAVDTGTAIRVPVRAFTADDGLGGATITSLIKDARGFLWIGTPDELLLYDGHRFLPFRYRDTVHRRMVPFRRAVITPIDTQQLLIFHEGGAHQYDQSHGKLYPIPLPLSSGFVGSRATLSPDNGKPGWYRLTTTNLTASYHPPTRSWAGARTLTYEYHNVASLRSGRPELLASKVSEDGHILYARAPSSDRLIISWQAPFALSAAAWLPSGSLLIDAGTPARLWWMPDGRPLMPLRSLRTFAFDIQVADAGDGTYFVAGGQTLLRFCPATGAAEELLDDTGRPLIAKGIINQLLIDGPTLWVGTNASGLLRVSLGGSRFRHIRSANTEHNFTHAIFPDRSAGRIYAGTYLGNVVVYDTSGTLIGSFRNGRTSAYINAIEPLPDGALLIFNGTEPYIYQPSTHAITELSVSMDAAMRTAGFDPKNKTGRKGVARIGPYEWWVSERAGLAHWKLLPASGGRPARMVLRRLVRITGLPEAIVRYAGDWWCGTAGKLYRITDGGVSDSFSLPLSSFVTALQADSRGRLWIATESGIIIWRAGKAEHVLTSEAGLPNNHVYALQPDATGWMWGSSNGGLFAVRVADLYVRAFTGGDGLQGAEFNLGASARDADGRLYFGGMNGLNVLNPPAALREEATTGITITMVAAPDTVYYTYPGAASIPQLELPHDRASLQISYTAAEPRFTSSRSYEYRLSDADSAWTEAGTDGELQLRLAPGDYHIVVRQRGVAAGAAELRVSVAPPFYRRIWFLLLVVALGGAGVAAILITSSRVRYRRKVAVLETAQRIQEEKERISRELHDELGARAALIAHNAGQLAASIGPSAETLPLAGRISETAADMLSALRETVWTLNQETVSAESLWLRYKNFIVKLGATYTHIDFVVREDDPLPTEPMHYSRALNLLRILQEATMNAVKHSGGSAILASVREDAGNLCFSVADNGRGFNVAAMQADGEGNGLYNMSQRSREADLRLSIRPGEREGTIVEVTMLI